MNPRKESIKLIYNGVDATRNLAPVLKSFTYVDSVDESDTLSLSLADREKMWLNAWIPVTGDRIHASITMENWHYDGQRNEFDCGAFVVDNFLLSGPVMECRINGVSAPVMSDFKETKRTKTWEKVTVRRIGQEIAGKYGLQLVYDAGDDIDISRQEQSGKPDSTFLKEICEKYGMAVKIYDSRLVIWNLKEYDARPPVKTITPDLLVGSWNYQSSVQGTYTGARVAYTDASKKQSLEVLVGVEGRMLAVNQKADSEADAYRIGENAIRNANRKENTLDLSVRPDYFLCASQNVQISGLGKVDGVYRTEKVTHSITTQSHTQKVSLSKIL